MRCADKDLRAPWGLCSVIRKLKRLCLNTVSSFCCVICLPLSHLGKSCFLFCHFSFSISGLSGLISFMKGSVNLHLKSAYQLMSFCCFISFSFHLIVTNHVSSQLFSFCDDLNLFFVSSNLVSFIRRQRKTKTILIDKSSVCCFTMFDFFLISCPLVSSSLNLYYRQKTCQGEKHISCKEMSQARLMIHDYALEPTKPHRRQSNLICSHFISSHVMASFCVDILSQIVSYDLHIFTLLSKSSILILFCLMLSPHFTSFSKCLILPHSISSSLIFSLLNHFLSDLSCVSDDISYFSF